MAIGRRSLSAGHASAGSPRATTRASPTFSTRLPGWIRTAVEFRHPRWYDDQVFDLVERRNAAYCVMSGAQLPCYGPPHPSSACACMAGPGASVRRVVPARQPGLVGGPDREWNGQGREVYVYFNNDGEGNAVRDAETLPSLLG
jgi:uncharacterized protein YecE (DUF72 family)